MFFRLLTVFAMVVMGIGAYRGFTTGYPGMGFLFVFGAVALAIPFFMERK